MLCRVLLAAVAVTYLLCVLVLSGIQKEDLDESTLQKLQRRNVNINDLNNEELRNKCRTSDLTINIFSNATIENKTEKVGKENGKLLEEKLQNETRKEVFRDENVVESRNKSRAPNQLFKTKNKHSVNYHDKNIRNTSESKKHNCNDLIKSINSQSKLNVMMEFWKNCVNVNKSKRNDESLLNDKHTSNFKIEQNNWLGTPSNKNFNATDYFSNTSLGQENTNEIKQNSRKNDLGYTSSIQHDNKTIINTLEHPTFNNQNVINEHTNSKIIPEKLLMRNMYEAFQNFNGQNSENKPNSLIRETYNAEEYTKFVPDITNENILCSENKPNIDFLKSELEKEGELPRFISKISNGKFLYDVNTSNKNLQRCITVKFNESPKIGIDYEKLFFHEREPKKVEFQRELEKVDDISKNTGNIPNGSYSYRVDIPDMNHIEHRRKSVADETSKFISTVPKSDYNFFYRIMEPNKGNLQGEPLMVDNPKEIMPNITKYSNLNNEYIINKDAHRKKTVNINNTSKLFHTIPSVNKYFYNQNEPITFGQIREVGNLEKPMTFQNRPEGNPTYHENDHNRGSLRKMSDKMDDAFKIIPDILNRDFVYSENFANRNIYKQRMVKPPTFFHDISGEKPLYQEVEPSKPLYESDSPKLKEMSQIYSNKSEDNVLNRDKSKENLRNEPVKVEETKIITNDIISDIAESVKAIILRDLKRELNIVSTTTTTTTTHSSSTTVDTTPPLQSTSTTQVTPISENTQKAVMINDSAIQDAVMNKVMKLLEQMNILKSNSLDLKTNNFKPTHSTTNIDKEVTQETSSIETVSNLPVTKPVRRHGTKNIYQNYEPQLHKTRSTNRVNKRKKIKRSEQKKKIDAPLTIQSNLLEIPPIGVYVNRAQDPINQNVVLTVSSSNSERQNDIAAKKTNGQSNIFRLKNNSNIPNYFPNSPQLSVMNNFNKKHDLQPAMIGDMNSKYNNFKDEEIDKYQTYKEPYFGSPQNMNIKLNIRDPKLSLDKVDCCDRQYVSQVMHDCCNERVLSRQQVSLNNANNKRDDTRQRQEYEELHYQGFIKSQQKVNNMLEKILASRNKYRSVEHMII